MKNPGDSLSYSLVLTFLMMNRQYPLLEKGYFIKAHHSAVKSWAMPPNVRQKTNRHDSKGYVEPRRDIH
jgi:hypothetical protein